MTDPTRDVARVFDGWAREGRDEGMAERHRLTAGPVLERLDVDGARLLDLGAGNGWAARAAARRGARSVGLDAARDMLAKGRGQRPRVELVQAAFDPLPFADASFDVAFSMEAVYYADDLEAALREVRRVLAPDAPFHAVIDYHEGNPASEGWPEKTGVPMHRLDDEGWARAFREAGFEAVATERVRVDDERVADWKADHGSLHVRGTA